LAIFNKILEDLRPLDLSHLLDLLDLAFKPLQFDLDKKIEVFEHFTSDNVRMVIETELSFKNEEDVKKAEPTLAPILKKLTSDELKEYLNKYKELFTIRYLLTPNDVKLARMRQLSELSLREPIDMTKPIKFIEYMVLAQVTEPFASSPAFNGFVTLEDYIDGFVDKETMDVDWVIKKQVEKPGKKPSKLKSKKSSTKKQKPAFDEVIALFDNIINALEIFI